MQASQVLEATLLQTGPAQFEHLERSALVFVLFYFHTGLVQIWFHFENYPCNGSIRGPASCEHRLREQGILSLARVSGDGEK